MITKYTSIRSVLYDLSLTIDERYWNEIKMLEWAALGYRQIGAINSLEQKVVTLEVANHKAILPDDFRYLTQVAEYLGSECITCTNVLESQDLPENSSWDLTTFVPGTIPFRPMRLTTNPYHSSICMNPSLTACTHCVNEFSISPQLILTTTLKHGTIMVSYLGYPVDENGEMLIPDDESLKQALLYFVLYRYWLAKDQMKEEGAERRWKDFFQMWSVKKTQVKGKMNMPGVNELENLLSQHVRLFSPRNRFEHMFLTLGNRENVNF